MFVVVDIKADCHYVIERYATSRQGYHEACPALPTVSEEPTVSTSLTITHQTPRK
jgi:hypothetical protein